MAPLSFIPLRGPWTAGDEGVFAEETTVEKPSKNLVRFAAHAHHAGVIDVTDGLDLSHVQSQEDAEKAQEAARGSWVERTWADDGTAVPGYWDGPWGVGNLAQHDLETAQRRHQAARADGDPDAVEAAEENLVAVDADIQARLAG